eukprot:s876_g26.t1
MKLLTENKTAGRSWGRAPSLAKRFERLNMKESILMENMKHVLVAYSTQFDTTDERDAACLFAAEASTGVGSDSCIRWPPFAESIGAAVYHCDLAEQDLRVAFSVAIFDRSILDGSVALVGKSFRGLSFERAIALQQGTRDSVAAFADLPDSCLITVGKMSGGSLLRLFRSEYFDAHLHMHYLLRMEQSGVQDYLVNELYKMTDDDVELCQNDLAPATDYYLPQLSQVALLRYSKSSLHRFLLDKAAQSMPFALKIHWLDEDLVLWQDRTPELYENAMAMLNLCEAAMVNSSSSSRKREDEASPGPPQVQRILRSSSDPDLQSNRAPSVEESWATLQVNAQTYLNLNPETDPLCHQTPGPMRTREADGSAHPEDSESHEHGEVRFNPPARQISGDTGQPIPGSVGQQDRTLMTQESSLDDPAAEPESPSAGILSEAEALRAAAVRHLAALDAWQLQQTSSQICSKSFSHLQNAVSLPQEQAFSPEERAQVLDLPASCPNAFQSLGLPIATGHPNEEDGLDDERLMKKRRCDYFNTQNQLVSLIMTLSDVLISYADKADRKSALAATLNVINRWLLDRRICMAVAGEGSPLFLLGAHIPLWRDLDSLHQILHVHVDMCRIFSSATRAPFVLAYESVNLDEAPDWAAETDEAKHVHVSHQTLLHQPATAAVQQLSRCIVTELHLADLPEGDPSTDSEHLHRLIKQVTPDQWHTFDCTMPKAAATDEPNLEETTYHDISQQITTYNLRYP